MSSNVKSSFVRSLFSSDENAQNSRRKGARTFAPRFETLEERQLLSVSFAEIQTLNERAAETASLAVEQAQVVDLKALQLNAPTGLTSTPFSKNAVTLSWIDANSAPNEAGWQVEYKLSSASRWRVFATTDADQTSLVVNKLTTNAQYDFRVKALGSDAADSEYSASISATPVRPSTPSAPTDLAATPFSKNAVALSWTDVASNEAGYQVEYKLSSASTWRVFGTTDADQTSLVVNKLSSLTEYDFRVKALGTPGDLDSEYTATLTSATGEAQTLNAPTDLTASVHSANAVSLTWTDANSRPNELGYQIEYKKAGYSTWRVFTTTDADATSVLVNKLSPNVEYDFRVKAVSGGYYVASAGAIVSATPSVLNDDAYQNNTFDDAYDLGAPTDPTTVSDAKIAGSNADWFKFTLANPATEESKIELTYAHGGAIDLDMRLYDANGELLLESLYVDGVETISLAGLDAGTYCVEIYNFRETTAVAPYELTLTPVRPPAPIVPENYAVIFSGGADPANNTRVYYDEVVRLYEMLVDDYGLSRENVYVVYADGTDPGADMNIGVEQNILIDSDMSFAEGSPVFSATLYNLNFVMQEVGGRMKADDRLLVYVGDHGGGTEGSVSVYGEEVVWAWDQEAITDAQFAAAMDYVQTGYATVILTQCFSGGILDNIVDPQTGAYLGTGDAKWYGIAAANHYETSLFSYYYQYSYVYGAYVINADSEISFAVSALDALDPKIGGKTTGAELFAYAKADDQFADTNTYANNEGLFIDGVEHPWGAGETFAIFNPAPTARKTATETNAPKSQVAQSGILSEVFRKADAAEEAANASDVADVCLVVGAPTAVALGVRSTTDDETDERAEIANAKRSSENEVANVDAFFAYFDLTEELEDDEFAQTTILQTSNSTERSAALEIELDDEIFETI